MSDLRIAFSRWSARLGGRARRLRRWLDGSDAQLSSADDIEAATLDEFFLVLNGFALVWESALSIGAWRSGNRYGAMWAGAAVLVVLACIAWRRFSGEVRRPMVAQALALFGMMAWATFREGDQLPSAAWWLSILPFVLAGAGLLRLAIAVSAGFIAVLTLVFYGPPLSRFGFEGAMTIVRDRRYMAVVGAELLAMALILVVVRRRRRSVQILERARRDALQFAEAKSRFLSNMSHEIRTPLNGVIGISDLLQSDKLTPEQRTRLTAVQGQSARALLSLVNDVLDWSKLDAGKVQLEQQPLDLRSLVFEVNELFAVHAFAKHIELTSSCAPDVPRGLLGDATRLRQIVGNLVSNAVKFTAHGGVHLHLAMDAPPAAGGTLGPQVRWFAIEVRDSGIGIAPDKLHALFDAFTQVDPSVTRRFGGTGLGLAISRELAQLMGGHLTVDSVLGEGSRFTLRLPMAVVDVRAAAPRPAPRADVLLASANEGVRRHLLALLNELRIEPRVLGHVPDAAELAGCGTLVIDLPLLEADAGARARCADAGCRLIVLAPLSANPSDLERSGATLLYKPVRRLMLQRALQQRPDGTTASAVLPRSALAAAQRSVLVVDDNAVNQMVVEAMLGELGVRCVLAADGRQALVQLQQSHFDLALMDMQMPELDGPGAARAWRRIEAERRLPRTVLVAMTANTEEQDRQACEAAGMDGFLAKPFSVQQLGDCLERWLQPDPRSDAA